MIYLIIENTDVQHFVDEVNDWVKKGFEPIGGVATSNVEHLDTILYTQSMVNREPEKLLSKRFKVIEKGIVPGKEGPEYLVIYQFRQKEYKVNLGKGLRNYSDEEIKDIVLEGN